MIANISAVAQPQLRGTPHASRSASSGGSGRSLPVAGFVGHGVLGWAGGKSTKGRQWRPTRPPHSKPESTSGRPSGRHVVRPGVVVGVEEGGVEGELPAERPLEPGLDGEADAVRGLGGAVAGLEVLGRGLLVEQLAARVDALDPHAALEVGAEGRRRPEDAGEAEGRLEARPFLVGEPQLFRLGGDVRVVGRVHRPELQAEAPAPRARGALVLDPDLPLEGLLEDVPVLAVGGSEAEAAVEVPLVGGPGEDGARGGQRGGGGGGRGRRGGSGARGLCARQGRERQGRQGDSEGTREGSHGSSLLVSPTIDAPLQVEAPAGPGLTLANLDSSADQRPAVLAPGVRDRSINSIPSVADT